MRISENALLVFETYDDTKFMHTGMDPDYKVRGHYLIPLVLLKELCLRCRMEREFRYR